MFSSPANNTASIASLLQLAGDGGGWSCGRGLFKLEKDDIDGVESLLFTCITLDYLGR